MGCDMWMCSNCDEPNEDQFEVCWTCGTKCEDCCATKPLEHPPTAWWRLALIACKTYILAVPAALLLSLALAPSFSQWTEWMQRHFEHQRNSLFWGAECGYVLCLVLLLLSAVDHDRKTARQALVFLLLALLSLLVFHPLTHFLPITGSNGLVG